MKNQKTTNKMKPNFICVLTILMFSGLLVMASMSLAVEDTWTKKADMPTARFGLSTQIVDGKLYAIGGGIVKALSTVEVYDTGFVPPKPTSIEAKGKLTTTWGKIKRSR